MESTYQALAQRILDKWRERSQAASRPGGSPGGGSHPPRLLIALAGPPGSGKTTVAEHVVRLVNSLPQPHPAALVVSADGFHLPLATLRGLPNAAEAIARRGAPWTFDGAGVVALARNLRAGGRLRVPTFDHAVKDPVAGGLTVGEDVQVCVLEGNYLLVDEEPWSEVAAVADDRWLVRVDAGLARHRVAARHLKAGIEPTMERALQRADGNDMVNGRYVMGRSQGRYDLLIESVEEAQSGN